MLSIRQDRDMGVMRHCYPKDLGPEAQSGGLSQWPPRCSHNVGIVVSGERRMPKQIGYAIVGGGDLIRHVLLPAFARVENSRVSAIVASDRGQAQALAHEFRVPAAFHLDEFRQCLTRDDVQAVYIAMPNSLHSDYTVDAARAGMHV